MPPKITSSASRSVWDKFSLSTFQGEFKFHSLKAMKGYLFVCFLWFSSLFIFICIYVYLCIYTPSYQHFKAFPMSKFNSETSFLYQLFKGNSNFIVWKPWKVSYFFVCFLWVSLLFIFICIYVYLCIYTPSYQHFKAFPVSKFNSETSFLYQFFKENSNFIVKKPCKVICLSAYDVFVFYITPRQGYLFLYVLWLSLLFVFIYM